MQHQLNSQPEPTQIAHSPVRHEHLVVEASPLPPKKKQHGRHNTRHHTGGHNQM